MPANARLSLQMSAGDRILIERASVLTGTTLAAFVRTAAREKATQVLEHHARLTLGRRDFASIATALDSAFAPNAALKSALVRARRHVRRA